MFPSRILYFRNKPLLRIPSGRVSLVRSPLTISETSNEALKVRVAAIILYYLNFKPRHSAQYNQIRITMPSLSITPSMFRPKYNDQKPKYENQTKKSI